MYVVHSDQRSSIPLPNRHKTLYAYTKCISMGTLSLLGDMVYSVHYLIHVVYVSAMQHEACTNCLQLHNWECASSSV